MENLENWRKAGRIAAEALQYGVSLVKNGAVIKEVCEQIDKKIIDLGASPAWPTQVGLNHVAAHFTPDFDDVSVFNNELVKLDVGACVEGAIGDNAATIDLSNKYSDFLKASKDALDSAIKIIRPGITLGEIGKVIQEAIQCYNLVPIRNLSGHGISEWQIHTKPSVPNFDTKDSTVLEEDQIIAIEPFATDGAGLVVDSERANIFSMIAKKPVRSPYAREIQNFIENNHGPLPFAERWLIEQFGPGKTSLALKELVRIDSVHPYPPLVEKNKGMVAVFEHTLFIKDKVEILTKI